MTYNKAKAGEPLFDQGMTNTPVGSMPTPPGTHEVPHQEKGSRPRVP